MRAFFSCKAPSANLEICRNSEDESKCFIPATSDWIMDSAVI